MIIEKFEILEVSRCLADPERIKFIAKLHMPANKGNVDKPLGAVLPIVYLSMVNARYTESSGVLSYTQDRHNIVIGHNGEIAMSYVKDKEELKDLMNETIDLLNRGFSYLATHGRPSKDLMAKKKRFDPLDLYRKHLPKTNCKECEESGRYAFAVKFLSGKKRLGEWPYAKTDEIEGLLRPIKLSSQVD